MELTDKPERPMVATGDTSAIRYIGDCILWLGANLIRAYMSTKDRDRAVRQQAKFFKDE